MLTVVHDNRNPRNPDETMHGDELNTSARGFRTPGHAESLSNKMIRSSPSPLIVIAIGSSKPKSKLEKADSRQLWK